MLKKLLPKRLSAKLINFYSPYRGAGIKLVEVDDLLRRFVVEMPLTKSNKNLVGTHFGGSLYSMCDPFYMWILMEYLGKEYIVWDKSAAIKFIKPGTTTVRAIFEIEEEKLLAIKSEVDSLGKNDYHFEVEVRDTNGILVALVNKTVYVKRK